MTTPAPVTYTIDWGDGTTPDKGVSVNAATGTIEKTHVYSKRGTYTVTVTNEKTGKSASRTVTVEDPEATPEFSVTATGNAREAKVTITYPV